MNEECLICGAPLEYLEEAIPMECAVCHRKEDSRTRCVHGHYVCDECHTAGLDAVLGLCLEETSRDPIEILERMMALPFCHMHGPEHHVMAGAALLTACRNAGGEVDLARALSEMLRRGKAVPGGTCGFWGACGAGISAGIYLSILTGATPLSEESWGLANQMTARALDRIGRVLQAGLLSGHCRGGPLHPGKAGDLHGAAGGCPLYPLPPQQPVHPGPLPLLCRLC